MPKQEINKHKTDENSDDSTFKDGGGNKRWNDKYQHDHENESDESSEDESDDDEEVVILRCQTSVCQDGDKCVPIDFDFVVHVRYGDEEDTPQAADTYFPYTIPLTNSGKNASPKALLEFDSNASTNNIDSSISKNNTN